MDYIGIDVHKVESQICILTESGEIIERRIRTERERFAAVLGERAPAKILIEASTESEWVARCLEGLGHEVVVADPNFAAMYATRSRKVKTDRRDARTLADACRLGAYRPAHRTSDRQRHVRAQLAVRESLVRTRAKYISLAGALLRREGWRVKSGAAESFSRRVEQLSLGGQLKSEIAPLLAVLVDVNKQVAWLDGRLEHLAQSDQTVGRLCSAPSVGPVTAAAFASTIDEPKRFKGAHQVEAYLGLVPSEMSSGEKQRKGSITKAGNGRVRYLLVQVALSILRLRSPRTEALREWAERLAARRGKKIAVVALARRMAGILYAMMRDGKQYQPAQPKLAPQAAAA
jgi:transposase